MCSRSEAGVHGSTPTPGLFYDASLFWIDVKDRIEAQHPDPANPTDTIDVNTGNTRHRGFEGQIDYDFIAALIDPLTVRHFSIFGSVSLLNAEFTKSLTLTGKVPASRLTTRCPRRPDVARRCHSSSCS